MWQASAGRWWCSDCLSDEIVSYNVPLNTSLKFVCTCIRLNHKDVVFCACYWPPSSQTSFCDDLHDVINMVLSKFPRAPLYVFGDFNLPTILWNSTSLRVLPSSSECTAFIDLRSTFNFVQIIKQPTSVTQTSANILNLAPTSPETISF